MFQGKKIMVIGCPGSGKSFFSKRLHDATGLPLIHLDKVNWNADRTHISREEFDNRLNAICSGSEWIIDGNYRRTIETRMRFSDTVIFLDYDEEVCLEGIS